MVKQTLAKSPVETEINNTDDVIHGDAIPINNPDLTTQFVFQQESYFGVLPHPKILEGYNKIDSSFADRIIADFEKNSEHSREMEKRDLLARIERDKRGQYMALIVAILLLGIVAYSLYRGNITFAGLSGFAFFVFIIRAFLYVPSDNKEEKKKKEEPKN